jgi:hypothetical protein
MKAKQLRHCGPVMFILAGLLTGLVASGTPAIVSADAPDTDRDNVVIVGGQDAEVDADGDRDAKFDKNSEVPSGATVKYFQWSLINEDYYLYLQARDISQRDEGVRARAGVGDRVRLRFSYNSLPNRTGSGSKFVLGEAGSDSWGPVFRIADYSQRLFEDPDADGTQFYTGSGETQSDNALVATMMRDLLDGSETFGLDSRRRRGTGGVTLHPNKDWTISFDARVEDRVGAQALGTGTYQRITDVNGDGTTDSDYFFSVRGIEIPARIDFRTSRYEGSARYRGKKWFADVRAGYSEFDNAFIGLTYDNPFWFNGTDGTSGSRRGLWEEGRASYEPSNQAWDATVSGGIDLAHRTRITAAFSMAEHSQDESFLPITSNPALIGTADVNGDGVVDSSDNPTLAVIPGLVGSLDGNPTMGTSLNASSDILTSYVKVTSKPKTGLTLTGRYRMYDYSGQEGIIVVPARAEYVESHIQTTFKSDQILHVPLDWSRHTIDAEASYRVKKNIKVKGFAGRKSYRYDQYVDSDGNTSRDSGSRAVDGTDDDFFGVGGMFGYDRWVAGRATFKVANREFSGDYTPGFSGELTSTRQFDIAKRDRIAADVYFDLMPSDRATIGIGYRFADDDYPDSEYGLQTGETQGWGVNVNYMATDEFVVFAYADMSKWDADMHLRTKCSNCAEPAGAAPWDIPNYDWFSEYRDDTKSFGAGLKWQIGPRTKLDFSSNYVKGEIEQMTYNQTLPTELNPDNPLFGTAAGVATGYDFPTQENEYISNELRIFHELSARVDVGLWWRFDVFNLDDFMWDGMQPYGADFLTVDDATRYMYLDSRYEDFTAHIVGLSTRVTF